MVAQWSGGDVRRTRTRAPRERDRQQVPIQMHILHMPRFILPARRATNGLSALEGNYGCGLARAFSHGEGTIYALGTLCNSAGFVGLRNGNLLHRFGVDSHPFGGCAGGHGDPADSGTQDYQLTQAKYFSASGE